MPTDNSSKAHVSKARQEAVLINHRDMSTEEITARITHHQTLMSLYENQRTRNQKIVTDSQNDIKTCDRMLGELHSDVATLSAIVKSRRG